jgi:hypothetical protein|tara:strand:+ start:597 stop:752 length:156 start_codon:yes stop_codon:yes gene_type:complete
MIDYEKIRERERLRIAEEEKKKALLEYHARLKRALKNGTDYSARIQYKEIK